MCDITDLQQGCHIYHHLNRVKFLTDSYFCVSLPESAFTITLLKNTLSVYAVLLPSTPTVHVPSTRKDTWCARSSLVQNGHEGVTEWCRRRCPFFPAMYSFNLEHFKHDGMFARSLPCHLGSILMSLGRAGVPWQKRYRGMTEVHPTTFGAT